MAQQIPLSATQSQTVAVQLSGQPCKIKVYQKRTGLYLDMYVNDVLIAGGRFCQNANLILRAAYLGFLGDMAFFDLQGSDDPDWTGLGDRFILVYGP